MTKDTAESDNHSVLITFKYIPRVQCLAKYYREKRIAAVHDYNVTDGDGMGFIQCACHIACSLIFLEFKFWRLFYWHWVLFIFKIRAFALVKQMLYNRLIQVEINFWQEATQLNHVKHDRRRNYSFDRHALVSRKCYLDKYHANWLQANFTHNF